MKKRLMSAVLKQKFLSGDENLSFLRRHPAACHARESGHLAFCEETGFPLARA
jgi:hypothetical protein